MSLRRPLVIAPDPNVPNGTAAIEQQLQPWDDLDIPIEQRLTNLKAALREQAMIDIDARLPVAPMLLTELGIS